MIINFLGDSITFGAVCKDEKNRYVNKVRSVLNCTVNNYGVSGTRIAEFVEPNHVDDDFQKRAKEMDVNADYVFVFGGTNDFGHGGAPLGKEDDRDPKTFYGGVNNLTEYLLSVYGREKLVFILPLRRWDEENCLGDWRYNFDNPHKLHEYVKVLKEVLDKHGIAYIDMFNYPVLQTPTAKGESPFFNEDGLHPNDFGHTVIAQAVIAYVDRMEYIKRLKANNAK